MIKSVSPGILLYIRSLHAWLRGHRYRTSWSYAITDGQPEADGMARQVTICPRYFTDDRTQRSTNTDGKHYTPSPRRYQKSWCIREPFKLNDFMVGGITLLHELTHLNSVRSVACYPEYE